MEINKMKKEIDYKKRYMKLRRLTMNFLTGKGKGTNYQRLDKFIENFNGLNK